jgi:hypothetical protein
MCFVSIECCKECRISINALSSLGSLESVVVLGRSVVLREAHTAGILQIWYLSIDVCFILLHVEFEVGLSISILKTGQLVS